MGHFSMEIGAPTGSNLSGNQQQFVLTETGCKTFSKPSGTGKDVNYWISLDLLKVEFSPFLQLLLAFPPGGGCK
jgi:hypothetical protein